MPGFVLRDFECSLCQARFTMLAGDLILPGPNLCDNCLTAVWQLEDEALTHYVRQRAGAPGQDEAWVSRVVQYVQQHREQGTAVADVIRLRR